MGRCGGTQFFDRFPLDACGAAGYLTGNTQSRA